MSEISRREFLRSTGLWSCAAAAGVGYGSIFEPHRIVVERVIVPIRGLPWALEGLRIVALSDFHLRPFTRIELVREAVEAANRLKPDIVVLLGDFVDETAEAIWELAPALSNLNASRGVFAVLGNHDLWKGRGPVRRGLEREGICVLRNSGVEVGPANAPVFLAGTDDVWAGRPSLPAAMEGHRRGVPAIALVHEPDYADVVARDPRVILQVSGHTHGGQVRLPGIGALRLPRWGQKYDAGLFNVGGMSLYTTRGIGVGNIPVRFNCPPEVTHLTLVRKGGA